MAGVFNISPCTILSVLGPDHTLTVLFLDCSCLNSLNFGVPMEPKPVSSQNAPCYRRGACTYKAHHPLSVGRCGMLHKLYRNILYKKKN
ncbi:hypothetical protein DVH24_013382 [Malus domestica]|uniref:Uncharacterized protein n=1 Tax=Malus domestica TaxID=3750 RepID=A0A498HGN7_MALDO|nr:hypothetical protein DVH24_013382 [Malus domestica]